MQAQHCLSLAAMAALTCGLGGGFPEDRAHAENSLSTASRIVAVYDVALGNFNLGQFRLTTTFRGDAYEMRGEGNFSILEGLIYRWQGTTASRGRVTDAGPEPAMYALRYSDGARRGEQLRMTFDGGSVQKVTIYPRRRQSPRTIPVTKEQLEGVLDPMSGAFLTASSQNPNGDLEVCKQILPVFDGLQRFDLVLSPKRAVTVKKTTKGGYGGPAVICRVKFIPIAGYQPDNPGIRMMSQTDEIEVWLIPVRGTYMYVPYRIVLPTPVGYGSAVVSSIQVGGAKRASLDR
ncbi:DUF3108 domain-containing protein [Methyloceanibacter sp.]|jgi:hypothetical protein|uniref:DUF3108 domain-containing protein n=1 Tax=Methyloceanibacter sp. TaxID=1965321 RepID=UPI002C763C55|nr:DUF3108 domain-containing protein [Methyloceanibacter sp.]